MHTINTGGMFTVGYSGGKRGALIRLGWRRYCPFSHLYVRVLHVPGMYRDTIIPVPGSTKVGVATLAEVRGHRATSKSTSPRERSTSNRRVDVYVVDCCSCCAVVCGRVPPFWGVSASFFDFRRGSGVGRVDDTALSAAAP